MLARKLSVDLVKEGSVKPEYEWLVFVVTFMLWPFAVLVMVIDHYFPFLDKRKSKIDVNKIDDIVELADQIGKPVRKIVRNEIMIKCPKCNESGFVEISPGLELWQECVKCNNLDYQVINFEITPGQDFRLDLEALNKKIMEWVSENT